jgi:hypothetical protein
LAAHAALCEGRACEEESMRAITGIFSTLDAGRGAVDRLARVIPAEQVSLLTPDATERDVHAVPTTEDMPPVGAPMGATLGGALGVASAFFIPGVGQIAGLGVAAGALLGAIGAAAGWKAGDAADRALSGGLPADEIYLYEDALRQGRTVVVALVEEAEKEPLVRSVLEVSGAESIDAARERWWLGLRDAEAESYDVGDRGAFARDERCYRIGFTAGVTGSDGARAEDLPVWTHLDAREREAVRRGFERGRGFRRRAH